MTQTATLPRVTAILRAAGLSSLDGVPPWAVSRGVAVHLACQLHDEGDLDETSVSAEVAPYLAQYRRFLSEMQPEILAIEEEVTHPLGYAGRLDRRMRIGDAEWLVDLKSGLTCPPWHCLQIAGYWGCVGATARRACLHLGPDRYVWREHKGRNDWKVFQAALVVAQWKETHA